MTDERYNPALLRRLWAEAWKECAKRLLMHPWSSYWWHATAEAWNNSLALYPPRYWRSGQPLFDEVPAEVAGQ
jgi:hypothetical protein